MDNKLVHLPMVCFSSVMDEDYKKKVLLTAYAIIYTFLLLIISTFLLIVLCVKTY